MYCTSNFSSHFSFSILTSCFFLLHCTLCILAPFLFILPTSASVLPFEIKAERCKRSGKFSTS